MASVANGSISNTSSKARPKLCQTFTSRRSNVVPKYTINMIKVRWVGTDMPASNEYAIAADIPNIARKSGADQRHRCATGR